MAAFDTKALITMPTDLATNQRPAHSPDRPNTQLAAFDADYLEERFAYLTDSVGRLLDAVPAANVTASLNSKPNIPSPQVTQSLTATGSGVQFTFEQVSVPKPLVIDGYHIYRSVDNFGNAARIAYVKQSPTSPSITVSDPTPAGSVFYFWVTAVDTTGTESSPAAAQATAVKSGSLVGSDGQVTFSNSTGKNMLGNPGFENNVLQTVYLTDLTQGKDASDEWFVSDHSAYHNIQIENNFARSGANGLLVGVATGVTIPNDANQYPGFVVTKTKIPAAIGDIVRISGYMRWDNNTAIPAGLTVTQIFGINIYSASDALLGNLILTIVNTPNPAYTLQQKSMQIPATLGGGVPAYLRVIAGSTVNNSSGSSLATSTHKYADLRWDDLKLVIQSTAFDLTPINTASTFTTTTSPLTQHAAASTQIDIGSSTLQFGDGTIPYNSGSVNPGGFGTWYIYADDPTFSGGAVSYQATATPANTVAANGRIYFGKITTVNGTVATGTGGGTGGGGPRGKDNLA